MIHNVKKMGGGAILAGTTLGRAVFSRLASETPRFNVPTPVFLDFDGVEVATSSFLREAVFAFKDFCRSTNEQAYPVVANACDEVMEELRIFADSQNEAVWCCQFLADDRPSRLKIIGLEKLDKGQSKALDYVRQNRKATAPEMAEHLVEGVGPTAWNNRLSALANKGLVMEWRQGKTKTFSPVLEVA